MGLGAEEKNGGGAHQGVGGGKMGGCTRKGSTLPCATQGGGMRHEGGGRVDRRGEHKEAYKLVQLSRHMPKGQCGTC